MRTVLGPMFYQRGTDTVNARLTPREAVLNRNAAELAGRGYIRHLNAMGNELARRGVDLAAQGRSQVPEQEHEELTPEELDAIYQQEQVANEARRRQVMNERGYQRGIADILGPLFAARGITEVRYPAPPPKSPPLYKLPPPPRATPVRFPRTARMHYQWGTSDVPPGDWTPEQLAVIHRIKSGQEDYTFGPGSPNPTTEDLGTYVGGPHAPASGFAVHGGVALAPSEYHLFTPDQRRQLGIMDIAPEDQAGKIERYYASVPGGTGVAGGQDLSKFSTWTDYQIMQEQDAQAKKQRQKDIGETIGGQISDIGESLGTASRTESGLAQSMLGRIQTGGYEDPLAPLRIIQPIQPWGGT